MINIFKKDKKSQLIEGIYQILCKKYSKDPEIWIQFLQYLFEIEADHKTILSRALQSLTKKAD